jgi:serine/threonine protein phosphatase 1
MTIKRLFVIGDSHGCLNELEKLLTLTDQYIKSDDEYVFLGDYIDRGPNSKGVVDLLIERGKSHPIKHTFLRGNHEEMLLDKSEYWGRNGGWATLDSYGREPYENKDWTTLIPKDHWEFYNSTEIYYKVGRTFCVHAGIDPFLSYKLQKPEDMIWDRRFVGYDGGYIDDLYVVYGHTPTYSIIEKPNQLGIDTSCVFGGKLTCAVIDAEIGQFTSAFQVKSEFSWKH